MNTPRLRMFAGPNGSGKSTLNTIISKELLGIYINPDDVCFLKFNDNKIDFFSVIVNSYFASVCADFIRHKLLEARKSFTFETVMSSRDKIEFLKKAQNSGYRTYLYFIATKDSIINISRVENRVKQGGHPVAKEKIISRYHRSLGLLREAVKYSNRAYIFDNSSQERLWVAQVNNSTEFLFKSESIPKWVKESLIDA